MRAKVRGGSTRINYWLRQANEMEIQSTEKERESFVCNFEYSAPNLEGSINHRNLIINAKIPASFKNGFNVEFGLSRGW